MSLLISMYVEKEGDPLGGAERPAPIGDHRNDRVGWTWAWCDVQTPYKRTTSLARIHAQDS